MAEDDAFLSRWSRRKALARRGEAPPEPVKPVAPASVPVHPAPVISAAAATAISSATPTATAAATTAAAHPAAVAQPQPPAAPPPPTLDDVANLPADASDYSRFVARGVQPEVKNAALKKLFSDPHFNVMDGLDIYIDDYGKPDPLPAAMLRQMVQSRFLGLFDDEDDPPAEAAGSSASAASAAAADKVAPATLAAATPSPAPPAALPHDRPDVPAPLPPSHEDADLRLQPHPAAGHGGPAPGAEPPERRQC